MVLFRVLIFLVVLVFGGFLPMLASVDDAWTVTLSDSIKIISISDKELEEVVVTGTLLHRNLDAMPGSISVISQIKSTTEQSTSINTILEQVPGVHMQSGTYNTSRLTIRGIGSRSPYASNRIRAFLNEIPLTGGDGATEVEDLEIWETSRVEIIRGPASALYGPGLGGTLVFRPMAVPNKLWSGHAIAEGGSFNFLKAGAHVAYHDGLSTLQGGIYRTVTDGHRQNNRYERSNAILRLNLKFGIHQLSLLINHIDLFAQIPSSVNLETFTNQPHLAASNWMAIKGYQQYKKWQNGLTLSSRLYPTLENQLSVYAIVNNAYESRPFNILAEKTRTTGLRNRLVLSKENIAASLGFEFFGERYNWNIYETIEGKQGTMLTKNRDQRYFVNIFIHGEWKPWPETRITSGVNLHRVTFQTKANIQGETPEQLTTKYPNQLVLSPRLGISQHFAPRTYLFASAGHGFSVPSSEEALLPDGTINTDLKPEEGINVDAGLRTNFWNNRAQIEITAYHIWVKNLLITRRDVEDQFYGENAGKTIHQGIESRVAFDITGAATGHRSTLKLVLAHTFMNNYFAEFVQNDQNLKGKKLPGLPTSSLNGHLSYQNPTGLELLLRYTYINRQYLNDANSLSYPGHELFDVSGGYSFTKGPLKGLNLKAGIKNLLDTNHASMLLVNAPSFGSVAPRYYYPGAPRNGFFGVSYVF